MAENFIDLVKGAGFDADKEEAIYERLDHDMGMAEGTKKGVTFRYDRIHEMLGLNTRILDLVPEGGFILDIGAGVNSRLKSEELAPKRLKLVNFDHIYRRPEFAPLDSDYNVAFDTAMLPDFFDKLPLDRALKLTHRLAKNSPVPELRTQISLLIDLLFGHKVNGVIFSHSLHYMAEDESERILRAAMQALSSGGKLFYFDQSRFAYHKAAKSGGYFPGIKSRFNQLYELLDDVDGRFRVVDDRLFIPTVGTDCEIDPTKDPENWVYEITGRFNDNKYTLTEVEGASENANDPSTDFVRLGPGVGGFLTRAERIMIVEKVW